MRRQRNYLMLTLVVSVLVGIIMKAKGQVLYLAIFRRMFIMGVGIAISLIVLMINENAAV